MTDNLREQIAEIVADIRDKTAAFCEGKADGRVLKSSLEWADDIVALMEGELLDDSKKVDVK
jgi:hypothetical protein